MLSTKMSAEEWQRLFSDFAHQSVFGETGRAALERISYARMTVKDDKPFMYVTVQELDSETAYWQYGGAFPWASNSPWIVKSFDKLLQDELSEKSRIGFRVENTNRRMLKLALSRKFLPIGIRSFKGQVFLEMMLERDD